MITTNKSLLHRLMMRDFTPLYKLLEDRRTEFMVGPSSHTQNWFCIASKVSSWFLTGFGRWRVARCNMEASLFRVESNRPNHFSEIELRSIFSAHCELKGCAFQGTNAINEWVQNSLGLKPLLRHFNRPNLQLLALEEKLCTLADHEANKGTTVYFYAMGKVQ